jgi:hypothetical protein
MEMLRVMFSSFFSALCCLVLIVALTAVIQIALLMDPKIMLLEGMLFCLLPVVTRKH